MSISKLIGSTIQGVNMLRVMTRKRTIDSLSNLTQANVLKARTLHSPSSPSSTLLTATTPLKPAPISKIVSSRSITTVSPGFFTQLKKEEHRISPSRKRIRFDYEDNRTGALALAVPTSILTQKHNDTSALLKLSQTYIKEHASRRVDLFFYTLVAYYGSHILPIVGHTRLQHGRGRSLSDDTSLTQACHSSFTPSLIYKTIFLVKGKINILSGTHLLESLNSTVELPPFVNAFDDLLEGTCRPKCIEILQQVAMGKLNPTQGLNNFLIMMKELLENFALQAHAKEYSRLSHPLFTTYKTYVSPKLIDLVREGTLTTTFLEKTNTVNEEYIQLLLRMTEVEKELCRGDAKKSTKLYSAKFKELQSEILNTARERSYTF